MNNYSEELRAAFQRTHDFGLSTPQPTGVTIDQKYIDVLTEVAEEFDQRLLAGEAPNASKQCFLYSLQFCQEFRKRTGDIAWLTYGYLTLDGEGDIFQVTEDDIKGYLAGEAQSVYKGHCWVTLPNLAIIDLTVTTTICIRKGIPLPMNSLTLTGYPEDMRGMEFHPLMVGEDFISRSNILRIEPTFF